MLLHESAASMEQSVPENLCTHVFSECEMKLSTDPTVDDDEHDMSTKESLSSHSPPPATITPPTKVKLSFSVDRLLGSEPNTSMLAGQCCEGNVYDCCSFPHCYGQTSTETAKQSIAATAPGNVATTLSYAYAGLDKYYPGFYMDYKSVLRPTPIRAEHASTFPTLATNALLRFHQQHHHQHQQHLQAHPQQQKPSTAATTASAALLAPLHSLKSLQLTQQQRFLSKTPQQLLDIPTTTASSSSSLNNNGHNTHSSNLSHGNNGNGGSNNNNGKRKRSWSRAVFTNLQRKGLEIQFQQQKYITKPDRRKLAARLNLTDAQVKVWFQNRRMKWRHTRENLKSGQEKQPPPQQQLQPLAVAKPTTVLGAGTPHENLDYSSDSCSSVELSEQADDDDNIEIDVVE